MLEYMLKDMKCVREGVGVLGRSTYTSRLDIWINTVEQALSKERPVGEWIDIWKEEAQGGWQPIETAPKDDTPVLLSFGYGWVSYGWDPLNQQSRPPAVCQWRPDKNHWVYWEDSRREAFAPTHWMPLPGAPEVSTTAPPSLPGRCM